MFSAQSVERGKGINEGLKRDELIPRHSRVETAVVRVTICAEGIHCSLSDTPCT